MKSLSIAVLCGVFLIMSASALAQTPAEIFHEMDVRKRTGINGVSDISKMSTTLGHCTLEYFEQETTSSADGRGNVAYMRLVPLGEVMARKNPDAPLANASAGQLKGAARELRDIAPDVNTAMEVEMMKGGMPGGFHEMLMSSPSDQPWLSPMPGDMMTNYAMMLEGAAEGKEQDAKEKVRAEQEAKTDSLAAVAANTRVLGRETVRDRPAFHLLAENLNYTQVTDEGESNEQEFTLNSLHLWVDADHYVPLKMQIDGVAREGSESRALRIEREDMAYRSVPGCGSMYEPQRTVMRIAGIMTPEQEAQMAEAQVQMQQFEAQMASMPQAQRDMIMRQMGPQMEMFQSMASGNGIEVVSLVVGMKCNAGLPTDQELMQTVPGLSGATCIGFADSGSTGASGSSGPGPGGSTSGGSGGSAGQGGAGAYGGSGAGGTPGSTGVVVENNLVRIIQLHLVTLGYDPGNTDGILVPQTTRAITQFEAANNMPITGQATPQLAGILAAAVDAMN